MTSLSLNIREYFFLQRSRVFRYKHVLQSVFALASGNFLSTVLSVAGGFLVARYLGPEDTGLFRSFTIPLMYLTFLHAGTFDGLYRQIPYYVGRDRPDEVNKIASASGAWNVIIGTVVSSAFLILACRALLQHDLKSAFGWTTQIFACWGTYYYGGYLGATYRTINQFVVLAKILLLQSVIGFILVFLIPFIGFYGLCVRAAIPVAASLYFLHRCRPLKIKLSMDFAALKSVIRIGMPLCFWGTLETSLWLALESTLLLRIGGIKALGLFSVAVILREGFLVLTRAVHQVLTPRIVESYARTGSLRSSTKQCLYLSMALVPAMAAFVVVVSLSLNYLVPLLFPKYVDGIAIMKVCLWMVVVQTAALPLNALFATGRAWLFGRGVLVGLLLFVAFAFLSSSWLGGAMAVVVGSLLGRAARVATCYIDLFVLVRGERITT